MTKGIILKIQRFSVQDGPGIRTTVFLKGCPLRCNWCSNPESQSPHPELMYNSIKCINSCEECLKVCGYISRLSGKKEIEIDRNRCTNCGKCTKVCCTNALTLVGESISVEELMVQIEKDASFYKNSGGGVTLSGGEPLFQYDFLKEILRTCQQRGIHTVLDTSGYSRWSVLDEITQFTDLILFDIKCMNIRIHRDFIGTGNRLIFKKCFEIERERCPYDNKNTYNFRNKRCRGRDRTIRQVY